MALIELLKQRDSAVIDRWRELILKGYPVDSSSFLKTQKDPFLNPVGHTIARETDVLYKELTGVMNPEVIAASLDNIIKIRAVQDFSPSEATGFIFLLKEAIRDELSGEIEAQQLYEELLEINSKIDEIALAAFDIYMKCREKIYEIRVKESKMKTFKLSNGCK